MKINRGRRSRASRPSNGRDLHRRRSGPTRCCAETDGVMINNVFFAPGARTHWHTHDAGQILHVRAARAASACGTARRGDPAPATSSCSQPGEEHWHGAAPRHVPAPPRDLARRSRLARPGHRRGVRRAGATDERARYEQGCGHAGRCSGASTSTARSARRRSSREPMQELVTEYCWGAVWNRDGPRPQDAQPPQRGHADRAEPPARARRARPRRGQQRLHKGGDPRGAAAGRRSTAAAGGARRRSASPRRRSTRAPRA